MTKTTSNSSKDDESAAKVVAEAKDAAAAGIGAAKAEAVAAGEDGKARVTSAIADTADALRAAAHDQPEGAAPRQLMSQAADGLAEIAGRLQDRPLGRIVDDVSDFARQNPVAFMSGAALAGFALARFAKASARAEDDRGDRKGGASGGGGQGDRYAGGPHIVAAPAARSAATGRSDAPVGGAAHDDGGR